MWNSSVLPFPGVKDHHCLRSSEASSQIQELVVILGKQIRFLPPSLLPPPHLPSNSSRKHASKPRNCSFPCFSPFLERMKEVTHLTPWLTIKGCSGWGGGRNVWNFNERSEVPSVLSDACATGHRCPLPWPRSVWKIQESTLVHWICESTLVTVLSFSTRAAVFILILKFSAALYLTHLENNFLLVLLLRPVHPRFFCDGGIEDRSPHEAVASKGKGILCPPQTAFLGVWTSVGICS